MDLEIHHGLNPRNPMHIWLIHHLFLNAIRDDADMWVEAWNSHTMQLSGQRNASPREMFFFSLVEDGPRGLSGVRVNNAEENNDDEVLADIEGYGVDWEGMADERLLEHFRENHPDETDDTQPFRPDAPPRMNEVLCEAPNTPFSAEHVQWMDATLGTRVDLSTKDMNIRRLIWREALNLCDYIHNLAGGV